MYTVIKDSSYHNRVHSLFPFDVSWNPVCGKNYGLKKSYEKNKYTVWAKFRDINVTTGGIFIEH